MFEKMGPPPNRAWMVTGSIDGGMEGGGFKG